MKRIEIDVVLDQQCDAPLAHADDARLFATPEVTLMHDDRVSTGFDRRAEELDRRGHAGRDALDARPPFHLQPVWAIIAEPRGIQVLVEVGVELDALHPLIPPQNSILAEPAISRMPQLPRT